MSQQNEFPSSEKIQLFAKKKKINKNYFLFVSKKYNTIK